MLIAFSIAIYNENTPELVIELPETNETVENDTIQPEVKKEPVKPFREEMINKGMIDPFPEDENDYNRWYNDWVNDCARLGTCRKEETTKKEMSQQEYARFSRAKACHNVYQEMKDRIKGSHDKIVERCATLSTLIYAFESWYWKSHACKTKKNCRGLMAWTREGKRYQQTFDSYHEWDIAFARTWYKGYINAPLYNAIKTYSGSDNHDVYFAFVRDRYDSTLNYFLTN